MKTIMTFMQCITPENIMVPYGRITVDMKDYSCSFYLKFILSRYDCHHRVARLCSSSFSNATVIAKVGLAATPSMFLRGRYINVQTNEPVWLTFSFPLKFSLYPM